MGEIRENLILTDQFSAGFSRFLNLGNSAVRSMQNMDNNSRRCAGSTERLLSMQSSLFVEQTRKAELCAQKAQMLKNKFDSITNGKGNVASALSAEKSLINANIALIKAQQYAEKTAQKMEDIKNATQKATNQQEKHKSAIDKSNSAAEQMLGTVKKMVAVAAGFTIGKQILEISDTFTQTQARLVLMNDSLQTTQQLQDNIFAAAQRSRTSYTDMADVVAKLGQRAGDAFSSNDETIAFAENLNKLFVVAGAGQQEISSASLQLTQALGSGILRGEEFNAVFEAAPNVIQTIADYLGVPIGKIKEMASNGEITAEVVKNALLGATDEIAEAFNGMPLTWGQAWIQMKNMAMKTFEPVLQKINDFLNSDTGAKIMDGAIAAILFLSEIATMAIDALASGAEFVADNWDYVYPILIGIGAALLVAGAVGVISGLSTAAAWIAAVWPFILIGAAVAALVLILRKSGVTFEQMGTVIGTVFGGIYALGHNCFTDLWNFIAVFIEFFVNVWDDPIGSIARLFFGLFDSILSQVETVANAIDAVLGTNMSGALSAFRGKLSGLVDERFGKSAVEIKRMTKIDTGETAKAGANVGSKLGEKMDNMGSIIEGLKNSIPGGSGGGAGGGLGNLGSVGEVGRVKKVEDVELSDEDIKMLQDFSERQYVAYVNLTTQAPVSVNQNNYGGNGEKVEDIGSTLAKILTQQRENNPTVVYG